MIEEELRLNTVQELRDLTLSASVSDSVFINETGLQYRLTNSTIADDGLFYINQTNPSNKWKAENDGIEFSKSITFDAIPNKYDISKITISDPRIDNSKYLVRGYLTNPAVFGTDIDFNVNAKSGTMDAYVTNLTGVGINSQTTNVNVRIKSKKQTKNIIFIGTATVNSVYYTDDNFTSIKELILPDLGYAGPIVIMGIAFDEVRNRLYLSILNSSDAISMLILLEDVIYSNGNITYSYNGFNYVLSTTTGYSVLDYDLIYHYSTNSVYVMFKKVFDDVFIFRHNANDCSQLSNMNLGATGKLLNGFSIGHDGNIYTSPLNKGGGGNRLNVNRITPTLSSQTTLYQTTDGAFIVSSSLGYASHTIYNGLIYAVLCKPNPNRLECVVFDISTDTALYINYPLYTPAISDHKCDSVIGHNGYIYVSISSSTNEQSQIFKLSLDMSTILQSSGVIDGIMYNATVVDGFIYYLESDGNNVYKLNEDLTLTSVSVLAGIPKEIKNFKIKIQ